MVCERKRERVITHDFTLKNAGKAREIQHLLAGVLLQQGQRVNRRTADTHFKMQV
jgi:hypothetical protein